MPAVVHRLDQDTSGVMLFVKDRTLASGVSEQFAKKTVNKEYLALCIGTPPAASFSVDAPIARHPVHAPARMLALGGKPARTRCSVVAYRPASHGRPAATLMRAAPETGRTHQIRLHLAAAGLPIVLDPFYGPSTTDMQAACADGWDAFAALRMTRQALHAAGLSLAHPRTRAPLRYEAPLPADMRALGAALGLLDDAGVVRQDSAVLRGGDDALAAALGGAAAASLDFEAGTCVPINYRDDPLVTTTVAVFSSAASEEDEEEDALPSSEA